MSISTAPVVRPNVPTHIGLPVGVGLGVYALLMLVGDRLLNDPDTYWQIKIGQWILDSGSLPRVGPFEYGFDRRCRAHSR